MAHLVLRSELDILMALSLSHLTHNLSSAQSPSTASVTVASGDEIMLLVAKYVTNLADPTSISGLGGTWVKVDSVPASPTSFSVSLWHGYNLTPGSGAITITNAATSTRTAWIVDKVSGSNDGAGSLGTPVHNSATGGGANTLTITIGALADANSVCYAGYLGHNPGHLVLVGYTMLGNEQDTGDGFEIATGYLLDATSVTGTGLDDPSMGIAVEIKAAGGGGNSIVFQRPLSSLGARTGSRQAF
jgi:hypothetical protein